MIYAPFDYYNMIYAPFDYYNMIMRQQAVLSNYSR